MGIRQSKSKPAVRHFAFQRIALPFRFFASLTFFTVILGAHTLDL
jgi:hypothetical protein